MSKVVQMADWRNRARHKRATEPGVPIPAYLDQHVLITTIENLLNKTDAAMASVGSLGTVYLREKAVLDSMKFREEADKVAKEHGCGIRKNEDGGYTLFKL